MDEITKDALRLIIPAFVFGFVVWNTFWSIMQIMTCQKKIERMPTQHSIEMLEQKE